MGITVVPAILIIDGTSVEDGTGITREEFYTRLPKMQTLPTTATPSIGTFENVYRGLFKKGYKSILSIHVSSMFSGMYNAAKTATQPFNGQVQVMDSRQLSLGLGYQVLEAAEASVIGLTIDAIIKKVEDVRQRVRLVAMLDTLEYVHRSGRVSWTKTRIGTLLNIKPFLEVKEGQVLNLGQVRTRKKGISGLIDLYKRTGEIEKLTILHTNAEGDARDFWSRLKPTIPETPLFVNVTTIVGTHIGPNALGFAVVKK